MNSLIFPLSGVSLQQYGEKASFAEAERTLQERCTLQGGLEVHAHLIPVQRSDGTINNLRCHIAYSAIYNPSGRTMIVFHGNGSIGCDMSNVPEFYVRTGWHVLLVTLGGYPGSDEHITTSEVTAIQDVAAVLRHLREVPILGVHGASLGGALALHAAQLSERVRVIVLDKTFTKPIDAATNCVNNLPRIHSPKYKVPLCLKKITSCLAPTCLIRCALKALSPKPEIVPFVHPERQPGRPYWTDRLDNVAKIQRLPPSMLLVLISGGKDYLMGSHWNGKQYLTSCAETLLQAAPQIERKFYIATDQDHTQNLNIETVAVLQRVLA